MNDKLVEIGDRMKDRKMIVGTHNKFFHADELFAIAALRILWNHSEFSIKRTRDPKILDTCDILVDVGGELNSKDKFDHHQGVFKDRPNGVPYASAGLVWRTFGKDVVLKLDPSVEKDVMFIVDRVDKKLIQAIDLVDLGKAPSVDHNYSLSQAINILNPVDAKTDEEFDANFYFCLDIATAILTNQCLDSIKWMKDYELIETAYNKRSNPKILVIDEVVKWQEHLLNGLQDEDVLFTVVPMPGKKAWQLWQVPKSMADFFVGRKQLPESWAGKRDKELQDITGIKDAIFCHDGRFVGGAESKESCIKMAEMAIEGVFCM